MERDQFYNLFVNANCLAELALRLSDNEMAGLLSEFEVEATPQPNIDVEAAVAAGFEGLDLNALDGMAFFGDDEIQEASPEPSAESADAEAEPQEFDINIYMEKAYSYEDELKERIEQSFERADKAKLAMLINQLNNDLQPITERQSGEGIEQWLDLYKANHSTVAELVVCIRQLDC